jgi:hypothetical protein
MSFAVVLLSANFDLSGQQMYSVVTMAVRSHYVMDSFQPGKIFASTVNDRSVMQSSGNMDDRKKNNMLKIAKLERNRSCSYVESSEMMMSISDRDRHGALRICTQSEFSKGPRRTQIAIRTNAFEHWWLEDLRAPGS